MVEQHTDMSEPSWEDTADDGSGATAPITLTSLMAPEGRVKGWAVLESWGMWNLDPSQTQDSDKHTFSHSRSMDSKACECRAGAMLRSQACTHRCAGCGVWRSEPQGPEAWGQLGNTCPHSLTLRASTAFHSSTADTHAMGLQGEGAEGAFSQGPQPSPDVPKEQAESHMPPLPQPQLMDSESPGLQLRSTPPVRTVPALGAEARVGQGCLRRRLEDTERRQRDCWARPGDPPSQMSCLTPKHSC